MLSFKVSIKKARVVLGPFVYGKGLSFARRKRLLQELTFSIARNELSLKEARSLVASKLN